MKIIEDISVIRYRDQVIIELVGTDKHGEIGVISYQFDRDGNSSGILEPKSAIQTHHREAVTEALRSEGFQLASEPS